MAHVDLVARACESLQCYVALGNECFEAVEATFVRNRATPRRYDANHVGLIRSADAGALIERADAEFAGVAHRRFDIDPLTPPEVEARLVLDGRYTRTEALCLVLEGALNASPRTVEIHEVLDNEDWDAYAHLMEIDHIEEARKHSAIADLSLTPEWTAYSRAKTPHVRYWLAYEDDMPVAFFNSWPGNNGIGQVEDLFTHPDLRHRGIATALIAHCVADARARGGGPVLITAETEDTPKQMYAALGFRPLLVTRSYVRRLDA